MSNISSQKFATPVESKDPTDNVGFLFGMYSDYSTGYSNFTNVQSFTANGTWINPSPTISRPVLITLIGGGGGGGSGRSDNAGATVKSGGGGGGGGALVIFNTWTNLLSTTEIVTIGAGGAGGAGRSGVNINGNNGIVGGNTTISLSGNGNILKAIGGNPGTNGSTTPSVGGTAIANATVCFNNVANTFPGGTSSAGAAATAPVAATYFGPTGGGGGGGITTANVVGNAGAGGGFFAVATLNLIPGAAIITAPGTGGTNGFSFMGVGAGGAGGTASTIASVSGGPGGNGGFPGGGGGGSGSYANATAGGSGKGGDGGNGYASIAVF